ncbi:MAG: immunity 53 family protein [Ignavibacteriales bacterium]|nr:immunity 53 family protein [Ignavibacteriales bacterium]
METNGNILSWLENWYNSNCNEDWEHQYGVLIDSLDNPGWIIKIDLTGTNLEDEMTDPIYVENSLKDWYSISVKDGIFKATGDPKKLEFLLNSFRKFVEERSKK